MPRLIIFIIFLSIGTAQFLFAQNQETLILSLEECIEMAKAQSPYSAMAKYRQQASSFDYQAFRSSLKPQINFSSDFPGLRRSFANVQQDDGSPKFIYQSQTYSDVSLDLRQNIPLTGGNISVFSSLSNFAILDTNNFTNWRSSPMAIRISQPLFQFNFLKWNKMEAEINYDLSKLEMVQELETVAANTTRMYFELLTAQQSLKRAQINVVNNDTIFQLSEGRFSVGKIAENELLQSQLNQMNARTSLNQAELAHKRAIEALKIQLGLEEHITVEAFIPDNPANLEIDPEYAVEEARKHSLTLRQNQLSQLQAERNVKVAKSNNRFTADINASFGLNQTGATLEEAIQNPIDQEFFSVGINVPIIQWGGGKAEVGAALTRQKETQARIAQSEKEFDNDIYFQVMNIKQLYMQLALSGKADTVASRRYEITKNRYLIGKISIQDLFIAQSEKDRAQVEYISNLSAFWLALANLRASTLFDFVRMQPIGGDY
ncbi:MAG: TolC family protein [Bacteroidetes bacterium]|nr:TolC family protein [Bacteroidota bacterium]